MNTAHVTADDPRTWGAAQYLAALEMERAASAETRAAAARAWRLAFDEPEPPRRPAPSACAALRSGDWSAFFDGCLASACAPF